MKKILLITTLSLGVLFTANAQVEDEISGPRLETTGALPITQGNWMAGGSIANLDYNFEIESFNFNLNPKLGYFVADNLALGAAIGLFIQSVNDETSTTFNIGPFARYYFGEPSPASKFYGGINVGLSASEGADVGLGLEAGYSHWLSRNVAIEGGPYYQHIGDSNSLGLAVGFQIYLPSRNR